MSRTLRPLALDFRTSRSGSRWAACVLAAAAVGFCAELGVSYFRAQDSIAASEARLAQLERRANGPRLHGGARAAAPEEIAHARETYLRLTTPWNELFSALETARSDKVVLVAIEPDPRAGTVVISGEAGDYPAVLDYVAGLQRVKTLDRVHLVKHEVRQNDPQRPAAFSVSASWSEARR